ncbi:hypothetical protein Tco_1214242 [Tanacetum coccineum]
MSPGHSARVAEVTALLDSAFRKSEGDEIGDENTDEDGEDESLGADFKRKRSDEEDHGLDDEGRSLEGDGLSLEKEEEVAPEVGEDQVPSTFEVGQSSRSMLENHGAKRVFAFRQPTLTTYIDPKDDRVYTDILIYLRVAPVQTPPSPEWSSGSLPISPSSSVVPSLIASPVATPTTTILVDEDRFLEVGAQLELYGSILHDHTQRLDALPPTLIADIDRDVKELYTRSGVVRDEIFSQSVGIRGLGRHERLELADRVARMESQQESREE